MQSIADILSASGVNLTGDYLQNATSVSADGLVIAGSGNQSWIAYIPLDAFAVLDLAGIDHTIGSLVWGGLLTNSAIASPATLTIGSENTSTTFSGTIQDGISTTALTKIGTGTQALSGMNSYSGATDVNAGTLAGGATNTFSPNSAINIASGAFIDLDGFNQIIGSLAGTGTVTNSGIASPATLTTGRRLAGAFRMGPARRC
jgi:autotransporter-associated beta strand protein